MDRKERREPGRGEVWIFGGFWRRGCGGGGGGGGTRERGEGGWFLYIL